MARRKTVLVVGTFRSGTNLMKRLLDDRYHADVVFNRWFWKHGVPPTGIRKPVPRDVPIIVMTRDPVPLNVSLYEFWKSRRPDLDEGLSLSEFVAAPFIVYDNTEGNRRPKYRFESPTAYWNQFHFSWLNWEDVAERRIFVRIEDLQQDPETVITSLGERLSLSQRRAGAVTLPEFAVHPSHDGAKAVAAETPGKERPTLLPADIAEIGRRIDPDIAGALGYGEWPTAGSR